METEKKDNSPENELDYSLFPYRAQRPASRSPLQEGEKERSEKRFFDELKSLSEESLQLSEYMSEDKRLCNETCLIIGKCLQRLQTTVELPAKALPILPDAEKVMLNPNGHLITVFSDGRIESSNLEQLDTQTIFMIVWNAIPQLRVIVEEFAATVKMRVEYFDRVERDLRSLQNALDNSPNEEISVESIYLEQGTDAPLAPEKKSLP